MKNEPKIKSRNLMFNLKGDIKYNINYSDYMLISKNAAFNRVRNILDNGDLIICNLTDRDGKINSPIVNIQNDIEREFGWVLTKSGIKHKLEDSYLYNIIFDNKSNHYYLEEHDKYFEKLKI